MTNLGKSTFSKLLNLTLNVVWYYLLLVTVLSIGLFFGVLIFGDSVRTFLLNFQQFPENALLFHTSGVALIVQDQPIEPIRNQIYLFSLSIATLYNIMRLLVIFEIRKVLSTSLRIDPFVMENVKRIRIIGLIYLIAPQINNLIMYLSGLMLKDYVRVENGTAFPFFYADYNSLFIGLVILLLAEAFRKGAAMKAEQDLTI